MKTSRKLAAMLAAFAAGSVFFGSLPAQAKGIEADEARILVKRHHNDRVPPPPPEMHRPRGHRPPPPEYRRPHRTERYSYHREVQRHPPEYRRHNRTEYRPRRHRW